MTRVPRFSFVGIVLVLAALACGAPSAETPPASPVPPTTEAPPSPTLGLPAEATPTDAPAPTAPTSGVIAHFAPGTPVTITAIRMLDASIGWALGGTEGRSDHVLRTQDGGLTWSDVTPLEPVGEPRSASAIFLDALNAWAVYGLESGMPAADVFVWRTGNAGFSWAASRRLEPAGEQFYPMFWTSADLRHGWLMVGAGAGMSHQYVILFRSEDGGGIWSRILDPYTDGGIQSLGKTGMAFFDTLNGWLTRDNLGVQEGAFYDRTIDGGTTWETVMLPPPADRPDLFQMAQCATHSARLVSPQSGSLAVECRTYSTDPPGQAAYLYRTTNDGANWSIQPYPGGEVLFLNDSLGFALDRDIYRTIDGGANWTLVKTVNWDGQFSFVDDQQGWAVATNEEGTSFVHTTNGAATWQLIEPVIAGE